jgi:hypothetical protein
MRPWQRGMASPWQRATLVLRQIAGWLGQMRRGGEPYLLRPRCCRNEQFREF